MVDDKLYYVYIIRCIDNSLYTGITTDVARRFSEHTTRRSSGEKYTRSRKPLSIEAVWKCNGRSNASKLESAIKKLIKPNKEELIKSPCSLSHIIGEGVNADLYEYVTGFKDCLTNK